MVYNIYIYINQSLHELYGTMGSTNLMHQISSPLTTKNPPNSNIKQLLNGTRLQMMSQRQANDSTIKQVFALPFTAIHFNHQPVLHAAQCSTPRRPDSAAWTQHPTPSAMSKPMDFTLFSNTWDVELLKWYHLVDGIPTPLKNMTVSWDDYSQNMESHKSHVPKHQPVMVQTWHIENSCNASSDSH